ncbi:MAG: hypothetical protein IMZ44_02355 [Planctomycetes bacterium]|nr:hypothetical protein [Planctomycetota bacterium]
MAAELYRPVAGGRWFVAPRVIAHRLSEDPVFDAERTAGYRVSRISVGADVGLAISRNAEWRLGYAAGTGSASVRTGDAQLPAFRGPERVARLRFVYDGQDAAVVPHRGVRLQLDLQRIFTGFEPYPALAAVANAGARTRAEWSSSVVVPVQKHHRLIGSFSGGTSFGATSDSYYDFSLGGPLRLAAYDPGTFTGRNYLHASATYLHDLGRLPDFVGGPIYVATGVEVGSAFSTRKGARVKSVVSAGVVTETLFGPVALTGGVSLDGHYRVRLAVGRAWR